ncbi:MAG: hypothetical protein GY756_00530 [bacterium]|nr:hypothetical protein [bacterium]
MFDLYLDMEMANRRNEDFLKQADDYRRRIIKATLEHRVNKLSVFILGNLGKAFSSIGDSLQSHYHLESDRELKKVS